MADGKVVALYISGSVGAEMQVVEEVEAIAGQGLKGDRYCTGIGSFNKGKQGKRQVTLINGIFFEGSGFEFVDSRRNIVTLGVELMWLIGREFQIGTAKFRGVKYCDPCTRPSTLANKKKGLRQFIRRLWRKILGHTSFKVAFHDRGGLIAEIIEGGVIKVGDAVIPPPKGY